MHRSEPVDPDVLKLQRAIVAHLRACWSTASADAYLDVVAAVVGAAIVDLVAHPQVAPSTQSRPGIASARGADPEIPKRALALANSQFEGALVRPRAVGPPASVLVAEAEPVPP